MVGNIFSRMVKLAMFCTMLGGLVHCQVTNKTKEYLCRSDLECFADQICSRGKCVPSPNRTVITPQEIIPGQETTIDTTGSLDGSSNDTSTPQESLLERVNPPEPNFDSTTPPETPSNPDKNVVCTKLGDCSNGQSCCSTAGGSVCVDTQNDMEHCGGCGTRCSAGQVCNKGICLACTAPFLMCNGSCISVQNDPNNCGACGKQCTGGLSCCNGQCMNLQDNNSHCGQCNRPCTSADICEQGICVAHRCNPDQTSCNGRCTFTDSDPVHCGKCNNTCPGGQACDKGQCVDIKCESDRILCGSTCIDPKKDRNNCGTCNNKCPTAYYCVKGICLALCEALTRCGDLCVDVFNDRDNCGECNRKCPSFNDCIQGKCQLPP